MLRARIAVAITAVAGLSVAGCTSSSEHADPAPSTSPTVLAAGTSGLRGVPVNKATCPTKSWQPASTPTVLVENVAQVTVCSADLGPPSGGTPSGISFDADMPEAADMLKKLSQPDQVASSGSAVPCPMYADIPIYVYTNTDAGTIRLWIPVDECGHYLGDARDAVQALTAVVR